MSSIYSAKSLRRKIGDRQWLLIAILLLAFALRLYGLGDVAVENDEGIVYHRWISQSFQAIMVDDLVLNNHTLAQVLARTSILLNGNSLFALRWPSVCLSILGVVFIYKLTSRLFGMVAGTVGALLLTLSPYAIFFAHNFDGYAGVMALPLLVYLLALLGLHGGKWRYWWGVGFAAAAMIYIHLFTALALLNLVLFIALVWLFRDRIGCFKKPRLGQIFLAFSITASLLAVLYAPIWLKLLQMLLSSTEQSLANLIWVQRPDVSASFWYNLWLYNGYWQKGSLGGQGVYVLLALVGLALVIGWRQRWRWPVLAVLAWAVLPFLEIWLAGQILPNFWVRPNYVGYTLPPLLMLAAFALVHLPDQPFLKKLPSLGVTLLPVILLTAFWYLSLREYYQVFAGADWQAVGNFLRQHSTQNDLIVCQRYPQPWREVDAELEDPCTRTLNYRTSTDVKRFSPVSTGYDLVFNILPRTNTGVISRQGRVWLVLWDVPQTASFPTNPLPSVEFNHFGRALIIQADQQKTYVANLAEGLTTVRSTTPAPDQQFSYSLMIAPLAAASGNPEAARTALELARTTQPIHPDSTAKIAAVEQLVESYSALAIKNPLEANFGGMIKLQGYDLNVATVRPGATLKLTLFWQALTQIKENYTVFLHLRDSAGNTAAKFDFQPFDGSYPTRNWQPGQALNETRQWVIPAGFPPGQYQLILGLYNRETLERLPLSNDSSGENALLLMSVWVTQP